MPRYVINARDVLTRPGEPARLRARLQWAFPLWPAIGVPEATIAVEPGLRGRTDAGGWIDLEAPPGRYTLCADRAEPINALVADVPADRELFVTDIDATISDASSARALVADNARLRPMADSVDVLRRLRDRFQIVYVTARNFRYTAKTKDWLAMHRFPTAPLITRDALWWRHPSRVYKRETMAALAARWPNIRAGVGDRDGDVLAYAAVGARAFRIGAATAPDGAIAVRGWKEIEERLQPY